MVTLRFSGSFKVDHKEGRASFNFSRSSMVTDGKLVSKGVGGHVANNGEN